jgi:hypothetical protein
MKEASVIDNDKDNDDADGSGKTGFETGGEDGEEEDATLEFSTFDYW